MAKQLPFGANWFTVWGPKVSAQPGLYHLL